MAGRATMMTMAVMMAALLLLTQDAQAASECCSTCIGKTADSVYNYDPLVYAQCILKTNGTRVCCFDCGTMGDPTYTGSISYASDGTTPTVKVGSWITMSWSSIVNVTYITLREGQTKTVTPTVTGTQATQKSGYFMICAQSVGSIVFRGWGTDTCRNASTEQTVEVLESDSSATTGTCSTTTVVSASSGSDSGSSATTTSKSSTSSSASASTNTDVANCNLNRASVLEGSNGEEECVCVSDWSNPPACDQMPAWKWAITIGGGVAALFSILISVRAFYNSRQKKKALADEDGTAVLQTGNTKNDIDTLHITPDNRRSPQGIMMSAVPYNNASTQDYAPYNTQQAPAASASAVNASSTRKADDREFTL